MTSAIPGMQSQATGLMTGLGNLSLGAGGLDLSRLTQGANMGQNAIGNISGMLGGLNQFSGRQAQQPIAALGLGNNYLQTLMGGANNTFGNAMQIPGFGLSQFNALTGAMNPFYNAWNQGIGNLYSGIGNSNNILGSLAGQQLDYMGQGMSGYAGLNAGSGNGSLLNALGNFIGHVGSLSGFKGK